MCDLRKFYYLLSCNFIFSHMYEIPRAKGFYKKIDLANLKGPIAYGVCRVKPFLKYL